MRRDDDETKITDVKRCTENVRLPRLHDTS